ncbi:MAG: glycosyltransferase family 2 protein [Methyloceanibacter sp.]|nr:glycosyltransferase family 2 protein [Methyloceanibacter sp.]
MATPEDRNARLGTASIVVLTHNRLQALDVCLSTLEQRTTVPAEFWIVDNGSTDGTGDYLDEWCARVKAGGGRAETIRLETNEGVCARNVALRRATGDFVLQVDDDVIVGPGWDRALLSAFSNPAVGAAGQEGFFIDWAGLLAGPWVAPNFLSAHRPQPGEFCDLVMGYCWAWRHQIVHPDALSMTQFEPYPRFGYDERFNPFWHEETDLQLQIKAAGYRIRCTPPIATHRSMKDAAAARNNDPIVGLHHAADHERLLIEKWGDRRADLRLELDRRG